MRIFSIALNLVNAAEVHHRLRVLRRDELTASASSNVGPLPQVEDGMCGTLDILMKEKHTPDEILQKLRLDLVPCCSL